MSVLHEEEKKNNRTLKARTVSLSDTSASKLNFKSRERERKRERNKEPLRSIDFLTVYLFSNHSASILSTSGTETKMKLFKEHWMKGAEMFFFLTNNLLLNGELQKSKLTFRDKKAIGEVHLKNDSGVFHVVIVIFNLDKTLVHIFCKSCTLGHLSLNLVLPFFAIRLIYLAAPYSKPFPPLAYSLGV